MIIVKKIKCVIIIIITNKMSHRPEQILKLSQKMTE